MDPAAIRELIAMESSQIDASFEYWLAASFAVVVTAYSARHSLSKTVKWVLSGVYLIFTAGTLIKFAADATEIVQMNALIAGTELDADSWDNRIAGYTRIAMYVLFTGVVVAFVFHADSMVSDDEESS